jgi:hypothetical protein
MLEDPWARLERSSGFQPSECHLAERSDHDAPDLSDSLIAQAGDSLLGRRLDPAPDVAQDASFASVGDCDESEHAEHEGKHPSDSMIPLIGDSIVQDRTSIATEDEDEDHK